MATYAIGDVQGCDQELGELLALLELDWQRDRLWFVGDLVNRGHASLAVLRRVRALGDRAITVLGNHDLHLLAVATAGEELREHDTLDEVLSAPDRDELLDWLRHRPLLHHDSELGWTMVHAGVAPEWDLDTAVTCARELEAVLEDRDAARELFRHMYGDRPDRWSPALAGYDRLRYITNVFTRLRFCSADGRIDLKHKGPIDKVQGDLIPWFRVPGRRSRSIQVVCGHWSALGYYSGDNVLAIDTGCVWGGRLCAVRLDRPEAPVFVPCKSSGLSVEQ